MAFPPASPEANHFYTCVIKYHYLDVCARLGRRVDTYPMRHDAHVYIATTEAVTTDGYWVSAAPRRSWKGGCVRVRPATVSTGAPAGGPGIRRSRRMRRRR